jgi:3-phenylpropionate/cinnamic acid dioxygenase small subunit
MSRQPRAEENQMADYSQVSNTFARYASAMDDNDYEMLRSVFTDDATFTVDITGGPTVGPYEGADAIVEFIGSTTEEQQDQRRHVITNVRLDGDAAYGILALFVTADGELTVQATGVYEVALAGEPPRFSSMYLTLDRPY